LAISDLADLAAGKMTQSDHKPGEPEASERNLLSKPSKVIIGVACVLTVASMFVPGFRHKWGKREPHPQICINNLRQIGGAKQQWALENHKTTNDVPLWDDVRPYLRIGIACPQGGTYTLGRVDEPPRCSIGAPLHTLSP
jgi:hypothetical protein